SPSSTRPPLPTTLSPYTTLFRSQVLRPLLHEFDRLLGGDVLKHDLEPGEAGQQGSQHGVEEDRLAIEDVDRRVGHLAVHQQRQRSEEHTSELQSREKLVCRLLLE